MIRDIDVAPVPVIKSGDPVNVIYVSGEIRLKVSGTSMGNAGVGEMLKVRNEDTGAVLLGKVINKNTIQVGGNDD
jgi:flagella basal body P-ring formation protein FlgA